MKKKNNKGFTLIEAIVTVTIMLLITLIAIPTTMKFIERGKTQQYEILEGQILSAASEYHTGHKNETCISLHLLDDKIDDKFIKDKKIIDPTTSKELIGVVGVSTDDEGKVTYELITDADTGKICHTNFPTLAQENTWYNGSTEKSAITKINIRDKAPQDLKDAEDVEKWNAAADGTDNITCYLKDGILTIAGNGSGKILANSKSSQAFAEFTNVIKIEDLELLDTSSVIYMQSMFYNCKSLRTLDISNFDTSNVTKMHGMFNECNSLTSLDVSNFDTSKVIYMQSMFYNCKNLRTLVVSNFNTSNVINMNRMFYECNSLENLDVSGFDTSKVTGMAGMFRGCSSLMKLDVSGFDTSSVTYVGVDTGSMASMFRDCSSLTELDVSGFDTSNVISMYHMFRGCSSLENLDVSGFVTSNVVRMSAMFYNCKKLKSLDVKGFDTSKVIDMSEMFAHCNSLENLDVSGFDTSSVAKVDSQSGSMYGMFHGCSSLEELDVSSFDTSEVRNMSLMFAGCSSLKELDISNFDNSRAYSNTTDNNMSGMFSGCSDLKTIYVDKFSRPSGLTFSMFNDCESLVGGNGTEYRETSSDVVYARIDGGASSPGYFTHISQKEQ